MPPAGATTSSSSAITASFAATLQPTTPATATASSIHPATSTAVSASHSIASVSPARNPGAACAPCSSPSATFLAAAVVPKSIPATLPTSSVPKPPATDSSIATVGTKLRFCMWSLPVHRLLWSAHMYRPPRPAVRLPRLLRGRPAAPAPAEPYAKPATSTDFATTFDTSSAIDATSVTHETNVFSDSIAFTTAAIVFSPCTASDAITCSTTSRARTSGSLSLAVAAA
mmetsp:Transcript_31767/g.69493  ORF Transcript_31767/g.69493 Transcript_31767/m.69493 type:complete len:228 (+) Transcript_31767:3154-3837(+)